MKTTESARAISPRRLAHIALRTNQLQALVRWYSQVLNAHVAFDSDKIAFLTYDDEHHRIALVGVDDYAAKAEGAHVGFYHTAFAYDSLADLMSTYVRLKGEEIRPYRSINHGPTVSLYYADPDGNQIELQVDSFPDAHATNEWMQSEAFRSNPIGIEFEPEEMLAQLNAGVPEIDLLRRADTV